jgi:hypothetical protein
VTVGTFTLETCRPCPTRGGGATLDKGFASPPLDRSCRIPNVLRHRADLECHSRLGGRDRRRLTLHRARQTAAERVHRELQRPAARRVVERDAIPVAASCPRCAGGVAARLQRRAATFEARLDDASGLRQRPWRRDRPGRCASLGLRAPASHPGNRRLKSVPDSRSDWMKNGGHVRGAALAGE